MVKNSSKLQVMLKQSLVYSNPFIQQSLTSFIFALLVNHCCYFFPKTSMRVLLSSIGGRYSLIFSLYLVSITRRFTVFTTVILRNPVGFILTTKCPSEGRRCLTALRLPPIRGTYYRLSRLTALLMLDFLSHRSCV